MGNNLKMKNIGLTMCFVGMVSSLSYGYDTVDLESNLWKLATSKQYCLARNFKGVDANIINEQGQTPLMVAAQENNSIFIGCMKKAQADVHIKDYKGKTAFDYIKKPTSRREQIFSNRTYHALRQLEVHQIIGDKALIKQEEVNLKKGIYRLSIEGAKCEEFAIPKDIQCVSLEKIDTTGTASAVYKKDVKRGVPPIFAAIQNRLYVKLSEILDGGADIEMRYKGVAPLIFAVYQYDDKLVKILLKYGANPNFLDKNGLYSPLSEVCVTNRISTVKLLLEHGADVNYQYKKSETALTVAAKGCKNFELVKLLLENGANPKLIDTYEQNTLTGLRRYCNGDEAYEKMKSFIELNTL